MQTTAQNVRLEACFAVQSDKATLDRTFWAKALLDNADAGVGDCPYS